MVAFLTRRRRRRRLTFPYAQVGLSFSLAVSLLFLGAALGAALSYIQLTQDLPSLDQLAADLDPSQGRLHQPTCLFDRTGQHEILCLENPAAAGRQYLPLDPAQPDHLPSTLVKATLAAQDPTFWQSPGYTWHDLTAETHPTLAQRLVYDLLLSQEPAGLRRNLRERLLAAQLIQRFGHAQVLEWRLNTVAYGSYLYGADAASRALFGKPAAQLSLAEAAFLTALSENPQLNPWSAPPPLRARQQEIIAQMLGLGWISAAEAEQAYQSELTLRPAETIPDLAPAFSQLALAQLAQQFPQLDLQRGGWRITTTLDYDLQRQTDCVISLQLARLQDPTTPAACAAAQLLPTLSAAPEGAAEDLAAAAVLLDPRQGQVLAMVGDSAIPRPAGTILTPIAALAAFARGQTPATLVWDIPDVLETQTQAEAVSTQVYRGPMRLRTALVNDILTPLLRLARQMGWEVIQATADQLGVDAFRALGGSGNELALLESQTTLLEATRAFGILAHQGVLMGQPSSSGSPPRDASRLISPTAILRLQDAHGAIWLDWSQPVSQPVISTQLAYLMNHVLSDEPARWLSLGHPNPLEVGRPAGAKIGSTLEGRDAWTIGYTPRIAVGVWVGKSRLASGRIPPAIPAGIWHALVQFVSQKQPLETWEAPPGIVFVDVCDPSGMLPTAACPAVVSEAFLTGSEPTHPDSLYRAFQINRQTGRLATVFTPPELIEEKVFLVPPPEAKAWAQTAGLPTPPEVYDTLSAPPPNPQARIDSPAMFAHVRGVVEFRGVASGAGFAYYRLQVGQGLNPQRWIQLGEDQTQPVEGGVLGVWDTRQLDGLYAVQLLVVRQDQRVERAVMQLSVDNTPPVVEILNPQPDQEATANQAQALALQVEAQDNLEVERVELWMDKRLLATLYKPPYLVAWRATPGEHTLLAQAYDLAGNLSETAVIFRVK